MPLSPEIAGILKPYFSEHKVGDTLWRASPLLKIIAKRMVSGKSYNFPLILGSGSGAYDAVVAQSNAIANGAGNNQQFEVTYGQMFSVYNILNQDILASRDVKGAFVPVVVLRTFQGLDAIRRLAATALYGTGFGEITQVAPAGYGITPAAITAGASNTIILPTPATYRLAVGSTFVITNGATPGSTLRAGVGKVTKMGTPGAAAGSTADKPKTLITFDQVGGANYTPSATDWIEFEGSRSGSTALGPTGLPGWLPVDRSGLSSTFFGVNRSINELAAGNLITRDTANNEKRVDATTRAVAAVRAAGGIPDLLVASPFDWGAMMAELQAQTNYWQAINTGAKPNKNEVARGLSEMSFAFSTNFVAQVIDDPYCPMGVGYILEKDEVEFVGLTNSDTPIEDGITGNEPGKEHVDDVSAPDLSFTWIADNYMTVIPGAVVSAGATITILIQMFGNFVIYNPSHCAVINFG